MKKLDQVLLLGDVDVDVLMPIPSYPQPGEGSFTQQVSTHLGGSVANAACVLAKLGLQPGLLGRIGRDLWGSYALEQLHLAGVEASALAQDEHITTGLTFIPVLPGGERTMFSHRGANVNTHPADLDPQRFGSAGWLHLSGYAFLESPQREAAWRGIELAEISGLRISLDTGLEPVLLAPEQFEKLVTHRLVCILGQEEARVLSGRADPCQAAAALLARGVETAAVKLGAQGCWLADSTGEWEIPAYKVDAVDSTGAGDAFSAGLIAGQLLGLSSPASGILAVALGALATTVLGAGAGLPGRREEVVSLLKSQPWDGPAERRLWVDEVIEALNL